MKRIFSTLILFVLLSSTLTAQQQPIYLFSDFQPGDVYMNGSHRPRRAELNIDALGQKIYFLQGETLMELTQLHQMDSLQIAGHTFVMHGGLLCERLAWQEDTVYVNWKFNKVNMGATGAMGLTTQNTVEVLWSNPNNDPATGEGRYSSSGAFTPENWQKKSNNTYFFSIDGQEYKATRLKDLYKSFPQYTEPLKAYVKEHHYSMDNAQQAIQILSHLHLLALE